MRFAQRVLLVALLVSALGPINATANPILINGSLELGPSFSNQDIDIVSGSTAIIGWTVTGTSSAGAIDYLGPPWNVSDGIHAVDLDGRNSIAGGIEQSFTTIVGQTYSVSFDLSGNPAGGPLMKEVRVAAGEFTQDYQFDSTGQTITSLIWQSHLFSFLASDTTSTLSFTSLTPAQNSWGPLVDNVSVALDAPVPEPVPEPASLLLLATGLGAAGAARKRQR